MGEDGMKELLLSGDLDNHLFNRSSPALKAPVQRVSTPTRRECSTTLHQPCPGYTSGVFAEYSLNIKIIRSLGRTGTCYDNAVAESFFATYKKELIHTKPWPTLKRLRRETFLRVEGYYNTRRRHSTLSYVTPAEIELSYKSIHELAA